MRAILFSALAVLVLGPLRGEGPVPSISVISQLRCGPDVFAVLQVSNPDGQHSLFFPLSSIQKRGSTVYDVRLEVLKGDQWHSVGRGADALPSGKKELRPGEKFTNFFQLPTLSRDAAITGSPKRLVFSYIVRGSHMETRTREFKEESLPIDNRRSLCLLAATSPK
jgi:hypothetical protein